MPEREDLLVFYRRYLQRCNEHRFDELGEFVANDLNRPTDGLSRYIAGLHAVVDAFPDYQWELQRLSDSGCNVRQIQSFRWSGRGEGRAHG